MNSLFNPRFAAPLLCSLAVYGGVPQDQPEVSSQQAPVTFSSRVNLVSVPVVVRDSQGHAVGNLREEDFRLFDKGKPQEIIKFSVQHDAAPVNGTPANGDSTETRTATGVAAAGLPTQGSAPAGLPDRYVAYVFDDLHLRWQDLAQMRAAAERHFADQTPGSRAAIYTSSGRVFVDFTDDRNKLHEALQRIGLSPNAFFGLPPQDGTDCPPDIAYYTADMIVNQGDKEALAAGMAEVVKCYGPTPAADAVARGISETVLASNRITTQLSLGALTNAVLRMSTMPGSRAIILISPGFMVPGELHPQEMDVLDRAIRAHVVISSLNSRGVYTSWMGDIASTRNLPSPDSPRLKFKLAGAQADEDVMADLADGTGGRLFHNDNGFVEGLRELAAPAEFTYVLGFSPQNLKLDGSFHNLKVTLVNQKGLELQARRGYWAPNHAIDPAAQAREEIKDAVFSQEEFQDIPLEVQSQFFKLSDTQTSLTVSSHIDVKNLRFAKSADRNDDTLTIVTGLFNPDGTYVKGIQRVVDLRLRDQTLESVRDEGLTIEENFEVPPGRYFVRVVVRDSQGQSMAARNGGVEAQ